MRIATRSVLLVVLLLAVVPPPALGQTADAACFISLANKDRTARGYKPLTQDATLTKIASDYAAQMAAANRAVPMANDALLKLAPAGALLLGQNVGTGGTCAAIHDNFIKFGPEDNRILDPRYDKIGVGIASGQNGLLFVHEVLMQTGPPPASPRPSPSPAASPSPSPAASPSPSPSPAAAPSPAPAVSPSPTESPAASPTPSPSPTESPTRVAAAGNTARRGPLLIAFGLALIAAAALGALIQSRRLRR